MLIGSSRYYWLALAASLLSILVLMPGVGGGFVLDDRENILGNAALHMSDFDLRSLAEAAYSFQPGGGSRALSMVSLALNYLWAGPDPRAFKITNLLIHAATVYVLAIFLRRLLGQVGWSARHSNIGAIAVALAWGVHPLQVSSVLYVVQRMQTMATFFVLAALWAYLCMRQTQMEGGRSRQMGVMCVLFSVLAFACKEDSILLVAYAFILELVVFHFRARNRLCMLALKSSYKLFVLVGLVAYLLVIVPRQWQWGAYPGRDFSSYERLLTQGRVLVMYLGQIVFPLPNNLPFFYDDFAVSRGLLQPLTTLFSLLFMAGLLVVSWCVRLRRPAFTIGVLLFMAGHFISSNVFGLELAFEHRNHFPLVGALLAIADVINLVIIRFDIEPRRLFAGAALCFFAMVTCTVLRAYIWGDPLRLAEFSVAVKPESERAWLALGSVYIERGGVQISNPWLTKAIEINMAGAARTRSALLLSNIVIYKTVKGSVSPEDWSILIERLKSAPMNPQNKGIMWVLIDDIRYGVALDEGSVLLVIKTISDRGGLTAADYLRIAAFIHNDSLSPQDALPYLASAVALSPRGDPEIRRIFGQLNAAGRGDWVRQLERDQSANVEN